MKKLLLITFGLFLSLNAFASNNFSEKSMTLSQDAILLEDGTFIKGEITKIGKNYFKIYNGEETLKISNDNVTLVSFAQELKDMEKYQLGILDGKRYAKNKGGNLLIGMFFGLIGTGIVYIASDQYPSAEASIGPNKTILNDANYIRGYSKGAKSKSGGQALIGTGIYLGLILIALSGA